MHLISLFWFGCNCIAEHESNKLLLAARKIRRAVGTGFIISLAADNFSRASNKYVGKLRQVLVDRNYDGSFIGFSSCPVQSPRLIFIHFAGLIFGAPNSLYTTVNPRMMLQFNQSIVQVGYLILGRCHQEFQHVAILLALFPMS